MTTTALQPASEFEDAAERYAVLYSDAQLSMHASMNQSGVVCGSVSAIVYTCWTEERGKFKVIRTYERTEEGLLADPRDIGLVVKDDYESAVAALGEPGRPVAVPVSVAREIGFEDCEFAPDDYHPSLPFGPGLLGGVLVEA
jgi:hypothetical protein